jgi:hypothetical protein
MENAFDAREEAAMVPQKYRLRPIMKQGTAASIPQTWTHYASPEDAREGAKLMYHNDRVLRVMMVTDSVGSFVEWIER